MLSIPGSVGQIIILAAGPQLLPPAFLGAGETAGTASAAEAAATVLPKVQPGPGCL